VSELCLRVVQGAALVAVVNEAVRFSVAYREPWAAFSDSLLGIGPEEWRDASKDEQLGLLVGLPDAARPYFCSQLSIAAKKLGAQALTATVYATVRSPLVWFHIHCVKRNLSLSPSTNLTAALPRAVVGAPVVGTSFRLRIYAAGSWVFPAHRTHC
jgi:hypothetical protein